VALVLMLAGGLFAQSPATPTPATPTASTPPDTSQSTDSNAPSSNSPAAAQGSSDSTDKKSLKQKLKDQFGSGCTSLGPCWGKDKPPDEPNAKQFPTPGRNQSAPRSDADSSSNDTKADLSPPGESGGVPPANPSTSAKAAPGGIQEVRPWDPHKADKDVEVGDYYMRLKNYRAAISRYREALQWEDTNAEAMYRLGQALEAVGKYQDARKQYAAYLNIVPDGKFANNAEDALDRLKDKSDDPGKSDGPIL